jgi:hypothetical protein
MPEFFEDFNALVKTCNGRTTTGSNGHSPVANLQETPTEQVHSLAACNTGQGP